MHLISISNSPSKRHAYKAVFDIDGKTKTVRFGTAVNFLGDHGITVEEREKWVDKRKTRDYSDPTNAVTLQRYLLYGHSKRFKRNLKVYMRLYDLHQDHCTA